MSNLTDGYSVWNALNFIDDNMSLIKTTVNRGSFEVEFLLGSLTHF